MDDSTPHRATIEPLGVVVVVRSGDNLMRAAIDQGYSWPTLCHGQAQCTICAVEILDGVEHVDVPGPTEALVLERMGIARLVAGPRRLACQLRLTGDVRIRKDGVRRVDLATEA